MIEGGIIKPRRTTTVSQVLLLFFSCSMIVSGQTAFSSFTITSYFQEVRDATLMNLELWNYDLYGPILLVDRNSRAVYANMPDSAGILSAENGIYHGFLPKSVNIANTTVIWSGVKWAMATLPLPSAREKRVNFLAHELFHRAQPELGFEAYNPNNDHLDKKDGRIYLRLELEALKAALEARSHDAMKQALLDAFTFRRQRHNLYPGAASTENLMELNEGITEFTGVMMSGRDDKQTREHLVESIDRFMKDQSYVRSFAYQTVPVYGYLLSRTEPGWNRKVTKTTDLFDFFSKKFAIVVPVDRKSSVARMQNNYNSDQIEREEIAREKEIERRLQMYREMFLEAPRLEIPLQQMNISFEYQNITPLGDHGTVYPVIRITDLWGILDAKKGALIGAQWNKVTVTAPTAADGRRVEGDGWTLELTDGYEVISKTGNSYVRKKQ